MSFYQSADSTDERLHHHFEDQSSATQFDARSPKQQIGGLVLSSQVSVRQQQQFDDRAHVPDEWQHQFDHRTSNNQASTSWRQHEIDKNTEGEYHPSNAQLRDMHQRPFADLNTSGQLSDRSQLRQLENQDSTAQLPGGWPVRENDSAEPATVRLPTFIYREPLPPYVPDESSPVQYHGKVVPPQRLGSYFLPRQDANPMPLVYPQRTIQHSLDQTAPVYPQVSHFAIKPPLPPSPQSYIAWSIFSMLCCCLPLGVAALVYSSGVRTEYAAGRYEKARSKSTEARSLNIASLALGLLALVSVGVYKGITIANAGGSG